MKANCSYILSRLEICLLVLILVAISMLSPCYANEQDIDLSDMTLEDLMDIEVILVSVQTPKILWHFYELQIYSLSLFALFVTFLRC